MRFLGENPNRSNRVSQVKPKSFIIKPLCLEHVPWDKYNTTMETAGVKSALHNASLTLCQNFKKALGLFLVLMNVL